MKLINKTIKITTRISASKLLQNRCYYHWSKNVIDLNHHRIDILKQSSNMLKRKNNILIRIISTITHENSIENIEKKNIYGLTTLNEEGLLWKLRLGILTIRDSDDFWKILQLYMMKNDEFSSFQESLSSKDIERIFLKFFQKEVQDYQRCILFWEMLRKSNIKLSSNCYNIILQNSASNEYLRKMRKVIFEEMKVLNYKPTMSTLLIMIKDYGKLGEMNHVKRCYQLYLKLGYKKTRRCFDYLIGGNNVIKNIGAVNHYLREMHKSKLKPSRKHVDEFIKLCALDGSNDGFDNLRWAFEKFYIKGDFDATSENYDWILFSCSKHKQRKLAKDYFKKMVKESNLRPSALTFQYLITVQIGSDGLGFPECKEKFFENLKEVTDLYSLMKREFLLSPNMLTCFILTNSLINHEKEYLKCIKILPELSYELLDKLRFNINPKISKKVDNKFLRQLFYTLLKYKHLDQARDVYKVMRIRKYNFAIETGSMNLIESYVNEGDHSSALEIFNEVISNGIILDQYHYNLLLKGFFRKNDFKGGMEFYESIESRNLIPSRETYNTVIQALINIKDMERARKIYQKLIDHHGVSNIDKFKYMFR